MSGKHTTSGGQGGMVITNNEEMYWNAKRFADRGKPFNSKEPTNLFVGLNYRMTELEAVIGRVQLTKMKNIQEKRLLILSELIKKTKGLKAFKFNQPLKDTEPSPWFLFVHYDKTVLGVDKRTVAGAVAQEGFSSGAHYVTPMYQQKWIKERNSFGTSKLPWRLPGVRKIDYTNCCPNAEKSLDDHITFYVHEFWTQQEIDDAVKAFTKVEYYYLSIKK